MTSAILVIFDGLSSLVYLQTLSAKTRIGSVCGDKRRYTTCLNFRDIRNRHVHDLRVDPSLGPRSNVHANRKSICNILFDGNSNVNPSCDNFRYIRRQNVHDLDLHL